MRALVVDDSAVMRQIVIKALAQMGVKGDDVVQAGDGSEAIAKAAENELDLILMDWNMPKTLGIDAVRAIRASGNKTPIIMVTTEGEKQSVVEAIQAGANQYLIKPFQVDDLVSKVNALLGA